MRIPLLVRNVRLQPDEALYATFARHVAAGDWFLSGIALDKPPLQFWMMGGAFKLFGAAEFAARLPNLIVSVITLALVYALAKRLYDRRVALIAMLLLAVLPFDRAFAASAFTDPLLTLWVVASSLAAVCGRWRLSGICLALALFAKPSALQSIPLVLALGIAQSAGGAQYNRIIVRMIRRFAIGFGAGAALLIGWSAARAAIPDFWTLNAYNNTPGRLIRANEWLPRLTRWTAVFGTIAPLPSVGWLAVLIRRRTYTRHTLIDLILTAYSVATLAALWLIAFNTYDRYLHTLAPFALILLARVYAFAFDTVRQRFSQPDLNSQAMFLTFVVLIGCAAPLFTSHTPIGGDANEYAGIDQLATALNRLPAGTIVYDHWLGWELGFYLGDQPAVQIIWQPTMDDLIAAHSAGYFVAPLNEASPWINALQMAGYTVRMVETDAHFVLYRIDPA